ncbi:MAG: hypothetical protein K6L75_13980 [Cellvibrionaceae bacterium]
MKDWIIESTKLLGRWDDVAAKKALVYLDQDRPKDQDEILMGYALAQRILDNVFARFAAERQTLSDEGAEKLEVAIKLARCSIPTGHPLLVVFLRSASHMKEELTNEVAALEKELLNA